MGFWESWEDLKEFWGIQVLKCCGGEEGFGGLAAVAVRFDGEL